HRYGGSVTIESEIGRGALFTLDMPTFGQADPAERTAAVTISDARPAAIVRMILAGMGIEAATRDEALPSDAAIWIVDESVPLEDLLRFTEGGTNGRRVVRLGEARDLGPGVETVGELRPSTLRAALDRALGGAP
ncbi:MAG TPA: hypothetical protein VFF69_05195, partial [Phycisphaerales bacterium]|nr:hypothetical protein [Phycisphaerales bacterium]